MFHATTYVVNRRGERKLISLDAIMNKVRDLCNMQPVLENLDPVEIAVLAHKSLRNGISTSEIDKITAKLCYERVEENNEYGVLALRIAVSDNHKNIPQSMTSAVADLHARNNKLYADWFIDLMQRRGSEIDAMLDHNRDHLFEYMGYMTLCNSYLLVHRGEHRERAQHMWMRTALEIARDDMEYARKVYEQLSKHEYTHATPTLFNSCLRCNQLSSCMLLSNREDSIGGIFETFSEVAQLSARAGGIGFNLSNVRSKNMEIATTGRYSDGMQRFLRLYEELGKVITQGGKRKACMACYIEVWMDEIVDVMDLMDVECESDSRLKNLFFAIWSCDLFAERCEKDEMWTMFSPNQVPLLRNSYGDEFRRHYLEYEANEDIRRTRISARELLLKIAKNMGELGKPYYLNKDACCAKSNMTSVAVCHGSNLCAEIIIASGNIDGEHEIGVCTLASINLMALLLTKPLYYNPPGELDLHAVFDFNKLEQLSYDLCCNLNRIIDGQYYPCAAARRSSERHRPIGIGLQGYADVCINLNIAYDSDQSKHLTHLIAEAIQYGAQRASVDLARGLQEQFTGLPRDSITAAKSELYAGNYSQALKAMITYITAVTDNNLSKLFTEQIRYNISLDVAKLRVLLGSIELQSMEELIRRVTKVEQEYNYIDVENMLGELKEIAEYINLIWTVIPALASIDEKLAENGCGYQSITPDSNVRRGIFQHDLWGELAYPLTKDWDTLRRDMMKYGQRNIFLTAYMPTATTSNILGNYPSFEPLNSNVYMVNALAGTFKRPNRYLMDYMKHAGIWTDRSALEIIQADGDVSGMEQLPEYIREVFRTTWQIPGRQAMYLSRIRSPFICQSQSLNMFMDNPSLDKICTMILFGHKLGLKTISYYLRTKGASKGSKTSAEIDVKLEDKKEDAVLACSRANPDNCELCGS